MKKLTLLSACMLLFTAVNAEQMQFVTTLSAPVGNFAHLDAADSTHVTSAPILNFCNTRSNVGNIVIKGANAYLKQVNIQNGTTLGTTNTPEYRLSEKLTVEDGGTVTAGRIMANNVTFKDTNYHKSQVTSTIYGNDIAVMGGKTDNMEISGTAKINKSAQNSANLGEELWWDNQYASDYDSSGNKKTNGKTYTSFLLKSKTAGCSNPSGEANCVHTSGTWDSSSCECTCPSNMVLSKNGACLGTFKPEVIDIGVLVNCHYCPGDFDKRLPCGSAGADPTHCYMGGDFNPQQGCCTACTGIGINSFEFYKGGYLALSPKTDSAAARYLWWTNGTLIGGKMYRYSGGSMPDCYGSDYQSICDKNCTPGSGSCSYKCLISMSHNGCSNGTYNYSGGTCGKSCNNASGTGQVLTCVANK
ncbi:hypothetical protein [Candidatus Avelusimicrobium sp.]|uniref:hypothetical protein n=1 Tax=Candidatus Avelusimicrobium sp. TaxID=3048833 RepID=UPI003D7DDBED